MLPTISSVVHPRPNLGLADFRSSDVFHQVANRHAAIPAQPRRQILAGTEFALAESDGYSAIRHRRFMGTGYFDAVQTTVSGGHSATAAMEGSTERVQFAEAAA
jgi:hypothetical protein